MDPLAIATAFADLVSSLGQFKAERENRSARTIAEYLEWLRRRDQQHLVDLIDQNLSLSNSLAALLAGQHEEVIGKLAELDFVLSTVASRFADFKPLAAAALAVLEQLWRLFLVCAARCIVWPRGDSSFRLSECKARFVQIR
jgi:hypothetical protein